MLWVLGWTEHVLVSPQHLWKLMVEESDLLGQLKVTTVCAPTHASLQGVILTVFPRFLGFAFVSFG